MMGFLLSLPLTPVCSSYIIYALRSAPNFISTTALLELEYEQQTLQCLYCVSQYSIYILGQILRAYNQEKPSPSGTWNIPSHSLRSGNTLRRRMSRRGKVLMGKFRPLYIGSSSDPVHSEASELFPVRYLGAWFLFFPLGCIF